ncbi:hypothetical protein PV10_08937 [Exophiala mesophila]|uniref:Altered inheritance of mitochondria protein 11 n=1 Tax=Exophiala mesophila TaxID=212818 RepID=A0A0D1XMI7_EXOME|nr:uncharacterized protein PV10_08937 [Exophiala mesophila]KIV89361.1 hypothetical protein PV10_08937 [Exophiala mesophila]
MSWLTSWFSSPKVGPTSSDTGPTTNVPQSRLLEEPPAKALEARPASGTEQKLEDAPVSNNLRSPSSTSQVINPNRNKIIFGAGLAFFGFSLLITKRAFARKRLANPAFYANGPEVQAEQAKKVSGPMEALEALNIATINVLSVAMMATGGMMWAFDINSMSDARRVLRGGLGVDGTGKSEKDAEEDFEEWMATVLARKEAKGEKPVQVNERGRER